MHPERDAQECSARLVELYGSDPAAQRGVLHVVACWLDARAKPRAIRIGPDSPASETDRFVLSAARARADAIVTTGRILREEPALEHGALVADPGARRALAAWRRHRVGRDAPARSVVLTSGHALDIHHPVFAGPAPALVMTTKASAGALRQAARAARREVEVVERERPSLRDTLECLRAEHGCETVLVEAGPSTAASLYEDPIAVDELLLSLYRERALDIELVGGALPAIAELRARSGVGTQTPILREESGAWSFERMRLG